MHLIETYATNVGVQIGKPYIYEKFIPVSKEKYIVFHPHSKPAKTYDYWQDVLEILLPLLEGTGISILQVGEQKERPYNGAINYLGHTDINQCAFLVRNSIMVLAVDSFIAHLAGMYDKPIVALYSNNNINNVKPYWGNTDKQILLEPKRKEGEKPSYSLEENPKSINKISPESIVDSVSKLLNLNYKKEFETIYTGPLYQGRMLELVPDQAIDLRQLNLTSVIVRMDYLFNEQMLAQQASLSEVSIVSDAPVNINLLVSIKHRINQFVYIIKANNHDPNFIRDILKIGIKVILISYETKETINSLKIHYMDYGLIIDKNNDIPDEIKNGLATHYRNGKFILSKGKIYPSLEAWKKNLPVDNFTPTVKPIDSSFSSNFYREKDHHAFLTKV